MQYDELYIGGDWQTSHSNEWCEVVNPATGETFGKAPLGNADDIEQAVDAARRAYRTRWRETDVNERADLLFELATIVEDHREELIELETRENGKPLHESSSDVEASIDGLRYYAGATDKHHGDTIPARNDIIDLTFYEPYGVVGVIIPWNWPPMHVCDFLAPALATGNTVVLKPAPETPLSALRLAELFHEAIPDGVFNVVSGGSDAGAALTRNDDVDKLAFTGNSETGQKVLAAASESITSTMLELGGKNANIIFADSDLDRTAAGTVEAAFYNTGEACSSTERILVQEDIYDEFLDAFIDEIRSTIRVGDGMDTETTIGPLTSKMQYDKVREYIELGKQEGASLHFAGRLPSDTADSGGYFIAPHVFTDVTPEMRIFQEEIFGPVVAISTFTAESEAVELANDVEFGLTAGIWTKDGERSMRVAQSLEVGMVYINNFDREMLGAPFGGVKKSGQGRKMAFRETMQEFSRVKDVRFALGTEQGLDS